MIATIIILSLLLVAFIWGASLRASKKREQYPQSATVTLFLGAVFLITGFFLTFFFANTLMHAFAQKRWPTSSGIVTVSKVVGNRAFRPDIEYEYYVNSDTLFGASSLNQPGFGGRMNRLDAAEKTTSQFSAGDSIIVYVNPENTRQSTLSPGPTYANFLKLGSAALLFLAGAVILCIRLFQPRKN